MVAYVYNYSAEKAEALRTFKKKASCTTDQDPVSKNNDTKRKDDCDSGVGGGRRRGKTKGGNAYINTLRCSRYKNQCAVEECWPSTHPIERKTPYL